MKTAEKLTDEANKKICSGRCKNLKPAAWGKEFSDLPWKAEDMKEICDNFRIIENSGTCRSAAQTQRKRES